MHMELEHADMAKSEMMTVRLTPEVRDKLEALARDTKRSKSYLASEAITAYVDRNAWQIEEIKKGLAEARSGTPGVPHEAVEKWVRSWDTEDELPRPTVKNP
jgi:predicted transcriptional regulator